MEKTLSISFNLADGKSTTISVKEPKPNLTEQEVKSAVSTILAQQAFAKDGVPYASVKSAKLIERYVTTYEV